MSATVAVRVEGTEANLAVAMDKKLISGAETKTAAKSGSAAEARLAVALEALTAIAGENDLTCMGALFRMRRRAEEALFRIRATREDNRNPS